MAVPAGYKPLPFGGWVAPDGSGPYFAEVSSAGTTYIQVPSGFYVKPDGSGPYRYDKTTRVATPATDLFRSAT